MHAPPRALAALVLIALAVGCTPTPRTTPAASSAQPTYLCTGGTQTATPFPCDKARYDDQQRTKALEAEALSVYQRYWKELNRLMAAGGTTEVTPEYRATLAGPMLENAMVVPRFLAERGWTAKPLVASVRVAIIHIPVRSEAEVSLVVCEDFTGTTFLNRDGQASGGGHLGVQHLAVRSIEGSL